MKRLMLFMFFSIILIYTVSASSQTLTVEAEGKGYISSFPSGILCGAVCSEAYDSGTTVTLTAKPDEGERLISFEGCSSTDGNTCVVSLDTSRKVIARFSGTVKKTFRLSISKTGSGAIESDPSGADCGLIACSLSYGDFPSGTEVTLTARPSSDSIFVKWEGDCSGAEKTCTLIMDSAKSVSAQFSKSINPMQQDENKKAEKVKLTVGRIGFGMVRTVPEGINCPPICEAQFDRYQTIRMLAEEPEGVTFERWFLGCEGANQTSCQIAFGYNNKIIAKFSGTPRVMPSQKRTLTVTNEYREFGTVTSNPASINCGISCMAEFADGQPVELSAVAKEGFEAGYWGGDCEGYEGKCTVGMDSDRKATVSFLKSATLKVTAKVVGRGRVVSDPAGLSCPPDCERREFKAGYNITYIAIPDEGAKFIGWEGFNCAGSGPRCQIFYSNQIAFDEVIAKFSGGKPSGTLKSLFVQNEDKDKGSIFSDIPGIDCGNKCFAEYHQQDVVNLNAVPKQGNEFSFWDGDCLKNGTSCRVSIDKNKSIRAVFYKPDNTLRVTAKVIGQGRVVSDPAGLSCPPDCERKEFRAGYNITYIAIPDEGAEFAGWEGSCRGASARCQIFYSNQIAFDEVTAKFSNVFKRNTRVKVNVKGSGSVVSSPAGISCPRRCAANFKGLTIELKATPSKGMNFSYWEGACSGSNASCMVGTGSDARVEAVFTQKPSLLNRIFRKGSTHR